MKKLSFELNKKGDIPSIFFAIVAIIAIGIFIFFFSHLFGSIYTEFGDVLSEGDYNNTHATESLTTIQTTENEIWDYVVLAIALSYIMLLAILGFSTRISAFFFWVYGIVAIIGLFIAVALSNTWQEMAAAPEFATTIARFPITNLLLGDYYPTFILGGIVITMILLFGKFSPQAT